MSVTREVMKVPLQGECRLLTHHASGLFAVEKAAGILSHPNHSEADPGALMALPYDGTAEAYLDGGERWFLLNRLDAPTSGVVLLAHSAPLAERVKAAFAAHQVEKTYLAVVKGIPRSKSERWKDCLVVKRLKGHLRTAIGKGPPNAETHMTLLSSESSGVPHSLLQLEPRTGKTHQLRVQCASRRLPILGDATYGDFHANKAYRKATGIGRLLLHAWRIQLRLDWEGGVIAFKAESPPPEAGFGKPV